MNTHLHVCNKGAKTVFKKSIDLYQKGHIYLHVYH